MSHVRRRPPARATAPTAAPHRATDPIHSKRRRTARAAKRTSNRMEVCLSTRRWSEKCEPLDRLSQYEPSSCRRQSARDRGTRLRASSRRKGRGDRRGKGAEARENRVVFLLRIAALAKELVVDRALGASPAGSRRGTDRARDSAAPGKGAPSRDGHARFRREGSRARSLDAIVARLLDMAPSSAALNVSVMHESETTS